MTEIRFYQLRGTTVEAALPRILEKATAQGLRAVVVAGSPERVAALDAALWTYDDRAFLPHGAAPAAGVDPFAPDHPVWITTRVENPNGATVLVLVDGQTVEAADEWALVCEMFDGNDPEATETARARWKTLKASGHALAYWRQSDTGAWEKAG